MPKEKVNYQEVYDLYQQCSETKDLKEFCSEYGVNYDKFMNSNWNLHLKYRSYLPIRLKCGGSDLGSWGSLRTLLPQDEAGNAKVGKDIR